MKKNEREAILTDAVDAFGPSIILQKTAFLAAKFQIATYYANCGDRELIPLLYGLPIVVADLQVALDQVKLLIKRDYESLEDLALLMTRSSTANFRNRKKDKSLQVKH